MTKYRIPEMTRLHARHDMIDKHTELPPLAEPRARMLYAFLSQQRSVKEHSELYTLVVTLVQLGMDTHDLIDTETTKRSEADMRSRQLKVLAGDFFSARFYQLLADAGQIELITKISSAVCEVNRLKVNLYTRMRSLRITAEDYFKQAVELRSELFQHFSGMLEGAMARAWPELLQGVSRCEVVLQELERSESIDMFERSWAYWHVLQVGTDEERHRLASQTLESGELPTLLHKYDVRALLTAKLRQAVDSLRSAAAKLDSDKLTSELSAIADQMINKLSGGMPALNETR
ncbi:heptaprenyl diphosphate synthase [Paenibacillus sp. 1011MAR3C5]|uniref:heptaprenyl diphosphate synthase component 1 n=1 Tax=Paenibacillus sp. 1011MAR3C5 TaxID=1675787 RepID=UPI000E6C550F|nr:heptaprenyl diphosphate synthase component 1 [Paenibacillus sp. 1011MAR3C5]RJE90038.1 heptaprenyl diphosphate synthase [Paenibacillus sp. 1011MAR3C5]